MQDFWSGYGAALSVFISLAVIAIVLVHPGADRVRFWFMDWWYGAWKTRSLSKDPTRSADGEWMNAERTLCADYKKYVNFLSEEAFSNLVEYLHCAKDLGRTPTPLWAVSLLGVLVIAEGLGFSYLLGGLMAMDGSENVRVVLMLGIVLTICLITVAVMHAAGHNLYRNRLVGDCRRSFKENGNEGSLVPKAMKLDANQQEDSEQPDYIRCSSRIMKGNNDRESYGSIIVAILLIAGIAIGSTYIRWTNLEQHMIEEAVATQQKSDVGNPFASGGVQLPKDVTEPQQEADNKAKAELASATKRGSFAGFVMLAIIFLVTQLVGIGVGYKYGFAGKESSEAFKQTHGFSTYDAYFSVFRRYSEMAAARLQGLQQRLEEDSGNKLKLTKHFNDYLKYAAGMEADLRDRNRNAPPRVKPQAPAKGEMLPEAGVPHVRPGFDSRLEEQMRKLENLTDKEAKRAYLQSLAQVDEPLYGAVLGRLREQKEEEVRRQQETANRAAELDALL